MFSYLLSFSVFAWLTSAQQHTCMYSTDEDYVLNLTMISDWTMELQTGDFNYYYTPCGNRMQCVQGNANYYANTAQYKQDGNTCSHYLSVDHFTQPVYAMVGASWGFKFTDGEFCSQTNSERETHVWFTCDSEQQSPAFFYAVTEGDICQYVFNIRSPLACISNNVLNGNCQYKVTGDDGSEYSLNLLPLKGSVIHATGANDNGYEYYLSPCDNLLHCYQQYYYPVMSMITNVYTGTCEKYLAVWEQGRVQPLYHDNREETLQHWSFHYFNTQKCTNGRAGEETVRYYCDPTADPYKVINATDDNVNCKYQMNIATKYACNASQEIYLNARPI